jgi:hypothetical protein
MATVVSDQWISGCKPFDYQYCFRGKNIVTADLVTVRNPGKFRAGLMF